MANVDVKAIATKVSEELHETFLKSVEEAVFTNRDKTKSDREQIDTMMIDMFVVLKQHNERFTIELVKQVVDKLNA